MGANPSKLDSETFDLLRNLDKVHPYPENKEEKVQMQSKM